MWNEVQISQIIKYNIPTPFYCFDTDVFERNVSEFKKMIGENAKLCFSVKSNTWLIETASRCADFLEVCSIGEIRICQKLGIPLSKISAGGVARTENECKELAELLPRRISVESVRQLEMLKKSAKDNNSHLNILLRLTSGNQFGMSLEEIVSIYEKHNYCDNISIEGIHYYAGTQKKNIADAEKLIKDISEAVSALPIKEIEFGAGIGTPLFVEQSKESFEPYLKKILEIIHLLSESYSVVFECGRFLTYNSGIYVTEILDIKEHSGRKFLIVDGGIHHLNYYGQIAGKPLPFIEKYPVSDKEETLKYTVCGSLCTVSDILAKDIMIPEAKIGDKLVFFNTGAYSVADARNFFLSREMPGVMLVNKNGIVCAREQLPTFPLNMKNRKEDSE